MKLFFLLTCLFFIKTEIYAQIPVLNNISSEDGLPSDEVHAVFQDANGFVWFATNEGVCRYDGKRFLTFDTDNGFPENSVLNFFPQSEHSVWVYTISQGLYEFDPLAYPVVFKPFKYNAELKNEVEQFPVKVFIRRMVVSEEGIFHFTFLTGPGYITVNAKTGESASYFRQYDLKKNILRSNLTLSSDRENALPFTYFTDYTQEQKGGFLLVQHGGRIFKPETDSAIYFNYQFGVSAFCKKGDTLLTVVNRYLIAAYKDTVCFRRLRAEGLSLAVNPSGGIYVGTYNGVEEFDDDLNFKQLLLDDEIITDIFISEEGLIWFTTHHQGVFYTMPNPIYTLEDAFDAPFSHVRFNGSYILLISPTKNILCFNNATDKTPKVFTETNFNGYDVYGSAHHNLEKYLGVRTKQTSSRGSSYSPKLYEDTVVFSFLPNHIGFIFADTNYSVYFDFGSDVLDRWQANDSTFFIGTRIGLLKLVNFRDLTKIKISPELDSLAVNCVTEFQNKLLLAIQGEGMVVLQNNQLIYRVTKQNGLLSNVILDIETDDSANIWLGTSKGLNRINISKSGDAQITSFTSRDGIPDDHISDISIREDTVWLATPKGVCFFKQDVSNLNHSETGFYIDSIVVDGIKKDIVSFDKNTIGYNSLVQIYLGFLMLPSQKNCVIEYKLSGERSMWLPVENNRIDFISNVSGDITLTTRVRYFNTELDRKEMIFQVQVPFWKTWWFIVPMSFVMLAYITLMVILSRYLINRKQQKELEKTKLELKALIAQMNPHFMFNTMNSIQSYLINHSAKEAVLYLSDFALLIRKTLDYSRAEFINLEEELRFLNLYVELEKKRFKNQFNFRIDLKLNKAASLIKFPALMLQPIIENSIIHGLQKVEKGELILTIEETERYFCICITDNGTQLVGKTVSVEKSSHGLEILRDRIRLHNGVRYKKTDLRFGNNIEGNLNGWTTQIILYK